MSQEIEKLAHIFPNEISQVNIYENGQIVAGSTIFETNSVIHAQYISASDYGRNSGALDLLFDVMINDLYSHKEYFDFGICNEHEGRFINFGLLDWKEGFGARTYIHKFFEINLSRTQEIEEIVSTNNHNKR